MSVKLPKGYRVVYVKEPKSSDKETAACSYEKGAGEVPYYVGEMWRSPFPLNLFIIISYHAQEVYWAGFAAIGKQKF